MVGNMVCSHCESVNPAESKNCPNCGAEFEALQPEDNSFSPVSSEPQLSPSTLPTTQVTGWEGPTTPNTKSRKTKKIIFISIAVIAVILLCLYLMSVIVILAIRSTGLNH